jgi:hypothetical protein
VQVKPSAAARAQPRLRSQGSFFDLAVPVKSANGSPGTTTLAAAIKDTLFAFTPTAITIDWPARTRVGSVEQVRLTARDNLTDLLRQKLEAQGIPTASLLGIVVLVVADLKPGDDAFEIQPENRAEGISPNTWRWRVAARKSGEHKLEATVTLTAEIPLRGAVTAEPALFSRSIMVDANPMNPVLDFLDRYSIALAESVAGLVALTWLAWLLWRSRRSSFSH